MKEEGLLYEPETRRFLHIYSDHLRLIINREPCEHEHSIVSLAGC